MTKKSPKNNLATKTDLKKLALKTDLKRVEKSLRVEILRVEGRVEETENKLSKQMKEQHDQVMTAISNFAGRVETLETENSVGADYTRELRVQVDDHETRITALEPQ